MPKPAESSRARRIRWRGTVDSRSEASSLLKLPGDAVLVQRGRPRWLVLSCPCGCGEQLPVNLDARAGPAWRFYRSGPAITLFPSVWRESGCESHFIIWRDDILLFGRYEDDLVEEATSAATDLRDAVLRRLPPSGQLTPFSDIAEALDAIPWDVLMACRKLVRSGVACEGTQKQRGSFGRR
jgi:hypothetical protein